MKIRPLSKYSFFQQMTQNNRRRGAVFHTVGFISRGEPAVVMGSISIPVSESPRWNEVGLALHSVRGRITGILVTGRIGTITGKLTATHCK